MSEVSHTQSYYAASAVGMCSYPEISDSEQCDVCVIGGGYTGLSTALNLSEKGYDTVLLEAKRVGWGASGRNGGQVGTGMNWSQAELESKFGFEYAEHCWNITEKAKREVVNRINRHNIPCDYKHGVLSVAVTKKAAKNLAKDAAHLQEKYSHHAIRYVNCDEIREMLGASIYFGGALDMSSGHFHPLNFAIGLARAAKEANARIFENSRALTYRSGSNGYLVETASGATVRARVLVIACNAYIDKLLPKISRYIMPIESLIVATEPLSAEQAVEINRDDIAVHDSKFCLNYYRLSTDRRLLFGGGEVYIPNMKIDIATQMKRRILAVYPTLKDIQIDFAWRGKIAVTINRLPLIGRLESDVYYAQGFSGHGVALTNMVGKILAETIAESTERFDVLAKIPHRAFPGGHFLRWPIHLFVMYSHVLADRFLDVFASKRD